MKRGGSLHPARPDWWPPTKQPWATPGGQTAASATNVSRREGVPPCLRKSPPLSGTLGVQRTSWQSRSQGMPAAWSCYLGSEVLWCCTFPLESQSSGGLGMQPYARAPGQVWPGHLHGTGCLSAWAMDTGFPTVAWRVCLDLGYAVTPPILAGVCGVYVWVQVWAFNPAIQGEGCGVGVWVLVFLSPRKSWLGCWRVCVCVRAPPLPI